MDFARRQLEKYGWTDGKGLGKHENGIAEALKPKLKRSATGIGHDAASEFNEHWWETLYNKAATNIQVEEKNGKTKKIKRVDESGFKITNSMWHLQNQKKASDNESEYHDYFIKKAVLTNKGVQREKLNDTDSETEEIKADVFKMTDEELFAACEGRTAHKGARHGLKALGKLARIEQQEQVLLESSKYDGYSHKKKSKSKRRNENDDTVIENSVTSEDSQKDCKIKKKKKKHSKDNTVEESETLYLQDNDIEIRSEQEINKKTKKHKLENVLEDNVHNESVTDNSNKSKKKKKSKKNKDMHEDERYTELDNDISNSNDS